MVQKMKFISQIMQYQDIQRTLSMPLQLPRTPNAWATTRNTPVTLSTHSKHNTSALAQGWTMSVLDCCFPA